VKVDGKWAQSYCTIGEFWPTGASAGDALGVVVPSSRTQLRGTAAVSTRTDHDPSASPADAPVGQNSPIVQYDCAHLPSTFTRTRPRVGPHALCAAAGRLVRARMQDDHVVDVPVPVLVDCVKSICALAAFAASPTRS